jgi:hypothetical protein
MKPAQKTLLVVLATILCLPAPLLGRHPWPAADYGATAWTRINENRSGWSAENGADGSLVAAAETLGQFSSALASAESAAAGGGMQLHAGAAAVGDDGPGSRDGAAEARAYDSMEVRQGTSVYTVGSQVFLRITATFEGTLSVDRDYGGAFASLNVSCHRAAPPGHGPYDRHEGCLEVLLTGEGGSLWLAQGIDIAVDENSGTTFNVTKYLDVPVTVGETVIVRGALFATCYTQFHDGGSCSADFSHTAGIVVTPAPGFEGIEIRSAAQAAQQPADTTPPTTVALMPNGNEHGWHNSDVTIALTATDNDGGSGVKEILIHAVGAQPMPLTSLPDLASVVISAEGETTLTFHAIDNAGNTGPHQTLTVRLDKTPPSIGVCAAAPDLLWPPNHKLVAVTASMNLEDTLSGPGAISLASAMSSEPDEGLGDGDMPGDIQALAATSVLLRAERSGTGAGRAYRLTYAASDKAGNTASCTAVARVPHESGKP